MNTIDRKQVAAKVFCHPQSVTDKLMHKHADFPRPIRVGRKLFWIESEIDAWILAQPRV